MRLSRELLQQCLEPTVSHKTMHVYEPHGSDQDTSDGDHIATHRIAALHVCREFRIVGLDICYGQNTFAFRSDEQLQSFLAHTDPEQIKRIEHIILEDLIAIHYSRHSVQNEVPNTHTHAYAVSSTTLPLRASPVSRLFTCRSPRRWTQRFQKEICPWR